MEKTLINKTAEKIDFQEEGKSDEEEGLQSDEIDFELDDAEDSTEEYIFLNNSKNIRTLNANENEAQEKKSFHPQYYKIQDRIKLLRQ
jgi:hypothetical protein